MNGRPEVYAHGEEVRVVIGGADHIMSRGDARRLAAQLVVAAMPEEKRARLSHVAQGAQEGAELVTEIRETFQRGARIVNGLEKFAKRYKRR